MEGVPRDARSPRHLLVCRHASAKGAGLSTAGLTEVGGVAARLVETLSELPVDDRPGSWGVRAAGSRVADATAAVLFEHLRARDEQAVTMVGVAGVRADPRDWSPYGGSAAVDRLSAVEDEVEGAVLWGGSSGSSWCSTIHRRRGG